MKKEDLLEIFRKIYLCLPEDTQENHEKPERTVAIRIALPAGHLPGRYSSQNFCT
jgi:hypothetical protein